MTNLTKLSKQHNMPYGRLQTRVYRGMSVDDAIEDVSSMKDIESTKPFAHNHSSGVRGVTWCKRTNKWQAQIQHNNKTIYCGRHGSIELAKHAILKKKESLKCG